MKKILRRTIPLVLLTMLLFVGIVPAVNVHAENTVGHELVFKKIFSKAAYGVATPNVTFNFRIEKHSFNGETSQASSCPDLKTMEPTIVFTPDDNEDGMPEAGMQMTKTSDDMLDGVSFTSVGQYSYTIKEIDPTQTIDGLYSSKSEFLFNIFIIKDENDNYVVDKIMGTRLKADDGSDIANPVKVLYTLDVPGVSNNNAVFRNEYRKTGGTDNPAAGLSPSAAELSGFVLSKKVVGSGDTIEFPFTIYLDPPWGISTATSNPTYKIVSASGVAGLSTPISYSTLTSIELAHNERLVLDDVLLGTFVRVNETNAWGYTKSIGGKMNGVIVDDNTSLIDYGAPIGEHVDGNQITFTNYQQAPTGIIISNLPFILVILVAAAGIVLFVRNRRRAYDED